MFWKLTPIYFAAFILLIPSSPSALGAAMMCGQLSKAQRNIAALSAIPIAIKGDDSRKPQEEFGNPENLIAQQLLGKNEIAKSASGVVAVECYYQRDGKNLRGTFNGVLVCDQKTLMVNAHSLKSSICNSDKNSEYQCMIRPDGNNAAYETISTPNKDQIMVADVCANSYSDPDLAILKLDQPSKRKPIKIGTVENFEALRSRPFVSVAANTSHNYRDKDGQPIPTDRTFAISQFDDTAQSFEAKSDLDIGRGSSGSAHLITQDQELLLIGVQAAMESNRLDARGTPIDGLPYDPWTNFSISIFFEELTQDFMRKHINEANKCFKEVRPANESSA